MSSQQSELAQNQHSEMSSENNFRKQTDNVIPGTSLTSEGPSNPNSTPVSHGEIPVNHEKASNVSTSQSSSKDSISQPNISSHLVLTEQRS